MAEALLWGPVSAAVGYAYLPIVIDGKPATVVINFNSTRTLAVSDAALVRLGAHLADTAQFATITVGTKSVARLAVMHIQKPTWPVAGPPQLAPVVGIVGIPFLQHYNLLYDWATRRVRLYAFPVHTIPGEQVWLPPGIRHTDCGRMVSLSETTGMFPPAVDIQLDGHAAVGAIEMVPTYIKMNEAAYASLGLSEYSSRVQPEPDSVRLTMTPPDPPEQQWVTGIKMTIGQSIIGLPPVQRWQHLTVQNSLPPNTAVLLMNFNIVKNMLLYVSESSREVCFSPPTPVGGGLR